MHALVCAGALLALPVLPGEGWKPAGAVEPRAAILAMLSVHVALPFVALAATGPLVQAWFARCYPSRSPYPLYAVSNLGSFLALVAYPFLVEPLLSLSRSGQLWSLGFVATAAAVLVCAALARREAPGATAPAVSALAQARPGIARVALWFLLPGCAIVLLMGITNIITLDVASVPFLWILPLGVYLATFVLCFSSERVYRRVPYLLVTAAPLIAEWSLRLSGLANHEQVSGIWNSTQCQIAIRSLVLFGACMVLHGELYRLRPPASSLTAFYLCLAAGGALGGIFVGALAPRLFDDYHEFELGIALAWLLLLAACWQDSRGWLSRAAPRGRWALALALTAILLPYLALQQLERRADVIHQERSFFGVLRVSQFGEAPALQRQLWNGSTLHGVQFMNRQWRPTSYYGVQTGIGLALGQRESGSALAVGVVGLGIGTLAAYGRTGDLFRFHEIDRAVVRLAREQRYFTFLAKTGATIEIVEGDARISLAAEQARGEPSRFDILIVDAFSSDAIPVHLLTREALAVYLQALKQEGLLAIHVSNRHFDLVPVLARLAADAGLRIAAIHTEIFPEHQSAASAWVFLARDEKRIRSLALRAVKRRKALGRPPRTVLVRRPPPEEVANAPLWTDDYSDLFRVLRPLGARPSLERPPEPAEQTGFDGGAPPPGPQ